MFNPSEDIVIISNQKALYNPVNHEMRSSFANISENYQIGDDDELPTYCNFCLSNFKQYYELVNGVCQSCGRIPSVINRNKQSDLHIRALNTKEPNDPLSSGKFDCVSLEFDYKDFNEQNDLAAKYPEKVKELKVLFDELATKNHLYPLITWDDVFEKIQKGVPLPRPSSEPAERPAK